jgi:molybdate transport system ATP-binding protein
MAEAAEGSVFILLAPTAITLSLVPPESSARNRLRCVVNHLEQVGERVRATIGVMAGADPAPANAGHPGSTNLTLVAEVTPMAVAELPLLEGEQVWASIKATEVVAYPR